MAYTKILVIHNRLDKCVGYTQDPEKTSLEAAIDYALDREKTEQTCFETAVNCDRESVYADMMDTKRRWGKEGRKRKGYHIIQSFAPGEVTPDQAHAVGVEFARRLLGDRYEAVVSTHLNKAHLHSHIVFNSVSFVDGAMYRDQLKDYYGGDGVGIRGTSDAICREHGLSIIEPSEPLGGPVSRAEWEAARQGKATVRDLIRQDVDEAIRQAYTYQSFLSQLRRMGYRVKTGPRVKHTAILPPGGKGYIRLDSLKDGYTEADIQARLAAVRSGEAPPDTPPTTFSRLLEPGRRYRVRGGMPRRPRKLTGFQALCFQYLCLLGAYPKRRPGNRAAFSMREELLKLDRYQEQFRYLRKNRIETAAQLSMQYDAIQAEIDALTERRGQLYRQKRRGDGGGEIQTEIEQITTHLRALRRDLKLKESIQLTEAAVKMLAAGSKNLAAFLMALSQNNKKLYGKANMARLLQTGRELKTFHIKESDLEDFRAYAKKNVLFSVIKDTRSTSGIVDLVTNVDYVPLVNHYLEQRSYPAPAQEQEEEAPKKAAPRVRPEHSSPQRGSGSTARQTRSTDMRTTETTEKPSVKSRLEALRAASEGMREPGRAPQAKGKTVPKSR